MRYRANQNGAPGFRQPKQIARQPYLARWVGGGPGNPLGARTLYLGNTDHRIYGTNNPASIGTQVSSGCIRMRNADVTHLYRRVSIGTKVIGLRGDPRAIAGDTPIGPAAGCDDRAQRQHNPMTARIAAGARDAGINPGAAWNETSHSRALY